MSGRSAVGSVPRSGRGGRWFESSRPDLRVLRETVGVAQDPHHEPVDAVDLPLAVLLAELRPGALVVGHHVGEELRQDGDQYEVDDRPVRGRILDGEQPDGLLVVPLVEERLAAGEYGPPERAGGETHLKAETGHALYLCRGRARTKP